MPRIFQIIPAILNCVMLVSGCHSAGNGPGAAISGYWKDKTLLEEDIRVSQNLFADFAEIAANAPFEEAEAALGLLFDRLKAEDEVAYYIYSEWMEGAFYNPYSSCRNVGLFTYAVDRIVSDGVMNPDEYAPMLQKRDWMNINKEGETAVYPQADPQGRSTLVLVLDLSCPSCREALTRLREKPEWNDARHLAICCGDGSIPEVPGWEYQTMKDHEAVFDIKMTPVYYVIDGSGVVTQSYTPAL